MDKLFKYFGIHAYHFMAILETGGAMFNWSQVSSESRKRESTMSDRERECLDCKEFGLYGEKFAILVQEVFELKG